MEQQENLPPHLAHLRGAVQLIPCLPQTSENKQEQLKESLESLSEILKPHDEERIHSLAAKIHLLFTALKQERRNSELIQKTGKDMMELVEELNPQIAELSPSVKSLLKIALVPG